MNYQNQSKQMVIDALQKLGIDDCVSYFFDVLLNIGIYDKNRYNVATVVLL